jgi:hypothetical protein
MTDPTLHQWITRQVERAEIAARAALAIHPGPWAPDYAGELRDANQCLITSSEGVAVYMQATVQPATILRRCEADRSVLARHNVDPDEAASPLFATACKGCGTYGDMDLPETGNLNDCPELRDLARAHGATEELLASLTRPQPPEPSPARPGWVARELADALFGPRTPMRDVPAALRGPRWTGQGQPPAAT